MLETSVSECLFIVSEGARIALIADEPFLFVPTNQSLCSITPEAAALWSAFEAGLLIARYSEDEQSDILRVVSDLSAVGAVEELSSEDGPAPVVGAETLAFGDTTILVTFPDEELHQAIMPAFELLRVPRKATDEQIVLVRREGKIGVARRDGEVSWEAEDAALPLLKIAITEALLGQIEGMALHAATVFRNDRAMLLLGDPGAGKSTLSLWLHLADFELAGDDIAELHLDGSVRAFPFPVTLKRGAWAFFESRIEGIAGAPTHRRPDGKLARYLPIEVPEAGDSRYIGWIVVLDRRIGAAPAISPLTTPEIFSTLLGSAWSGSSALTPEGFEAISACIDGAHCVRLTYSNLDAAAEMLGRFCDGGNT